MNMIQSRSVKSWLYLDEFEKKQTRRRRGRRRRMKLILINCQLLLISLAFLYLQVKAQHLPPSRSLPAETILLENGSTTFVSTLDEYLATQAYSLPLKLNESSSEKIILKPDNLEREEVKQPQTSKLESNINNQHEHKQHGAHETSTNSNDSTKPIPQHWQVKSLLNVTQDYPLAYTQIINGYIWPLMAAITLCTNLMIVFVLTQRDMRTPTNVVLTAIAIADIIPIVVPVPWLVYLFAMGHEKEVLYPPLACYIYQHSTRSISEIFYFLSTWLNVLLAVQDYLTACRPNLAKRWCQIKVVVIEIILLTLFAFLLNSPQALKLVFKPVKFYYNGKITYGCRALQARWFKDLVGEYVALYDDIFTAIIVLFVDGGPAIALITLSALLIRQLHRQRIQGHILMEQARTASKRRLERHRQQEYESSARVMIFVLLAFLAVKIPFATTYSLMIIQSRFNIHFVDNLVDFQKAISITDLVFVLSYPINFTIFCCCSKKFRHKCIQLFGQFNNNTKTARNKLMRSFSESVYSDSIMSCLSRQRQSIQTLGKDDSNSLQQQFNQQGFNQTDRSLSTIKGSTNSDETSLLEHCLSTRKRSIGTITERTPFFCNSSCESENHNNLNHDSSTGDYSTFEPLIPAQFKAQLENGNICLECIMRYEQLKQFNGRPVELWQARKSSADSSIWPAPPPPPPPPLQSAMVGQQFKLPHIITTRCESILEQEPENCSGTLARDPSSNLEGGGEQSFTFDEQEPRHERQTYDVTTIQLSREAESCSTRGSSDPGTGGFLGSVKHLASFLRRSSGNSNPDETLGSPNHEAHLSLLKPEGAGERKKLEETKRRSLSMSDSKLSTLPNATGLLADVMMTTLLGSTASSSGLAKSAQSHPAAGGPVHSKQREKWRESIGLKRS